MRSVYLFLAPLPPLSQRNAPGSRSVYSPLARHPPLATAPSEANGILSRSSLVAAISARYWCPRPAVFSGTMFFTGARGSRASRGRGCDCCPRSLLGTGACGPRNSRGRGRYWCSRPLFLTRACGPQGSRAQSRFRYPRPTGLSRLWSLLVLATSSLLVPVARARGRSPYRSPKSAGL